MTLKLENFDALKLTGLPPKMRPVVATMMVEILTAMLIVSTRRPAEAKALMAETKVLLRRYLSPYEAKEGPGRPEARKRSDRRRAAVRSTR